jgi:hypothetical protein
MESRKQSEFSLSIIYNLTFNKQSQEDCDWQRTGNGDSQNENGSDRVLPRVRFHES